MTFLQNHVTAKTEYFIKNKEKKNGDKKKSKTDERQVHRKDPPLKKKKIKCQNIVI